jgi:hypothetical protein
MMLFQDFSVMGIAQSLFVRPDGPGAYWSARQSVKGYRRA